MPAPPPDRTTRDIAYGCFLIPGVGALVGTIAELAPSDATSVYGIALLVGLPLMVAAIPAVPVAVVLSLKVARDPALLVLSVATIGAIIELFGEYGGGVAVATVFAIYGFLVLALAVSWFFIRRKSFR